MASSKTNVAKEINKSRTTERYELYYRVVKSTNREGTESDIVSGAKMVFFASSNSQATVHAESRLRVEEERQQGLNRDSIVKVVPLGLFRVEEILVPVKSDTF